MIWLFIALAVCATFVIAAVTVGGVTADLATRPKRSTYDLEEAVVFVGDQLPQDVTSEISYEDVQAVLLAHLAYLEKKGVASYATADEIGDGFIVVSDDEPLAFVIGEMENSTQVLTDEVIVAILEAENAYYRSIGAIGTVVDGPA